MNRAEAPSEPLAARNFGRLATGAAFLTFCMIVIGAVVRVSGSGMGCGTDWPSCNGQILPGAADLQNTATAIEFGHRLFALLVGLVTVAVAVQAWRLYRNVPRVFIPAMLAVVVYLAQSALGAITVASSNEWVSVALHMANSLLLLACFVIIGVAVRPPDPADRRDGRAAGLPFSEVMGAAILAFLVVLAGSVVAGNNARQACGGVFGSSWPLCLGTVWPAQFGDAAMLNMSHRIVAGLLGILLVVLLVQAYRGGASRTTRRALMAAFGPYIMQALLGIGVVLVSNDSQTGLIVVRSLHVALAAAVWWGMVLVAGVVWQQQFIWTQRTTPGVTARSATISN